MSSTTINSLTVHLEELASEKAARFITWDDSARGKKEDGTPHVFGTDVTDASLGSATGSTRYAAITGRDQLDRIEGLVSCDKIAMVTQSTEDPTVLESITLYDFVRELGFEIDDGEKVLINTKLHFIPTGEDVVGNLYNYNWAEKLVVTANAQGVGIQKGGRGQTRHYIDFVKQNSDGSKSTVQRSIKITSSGRSIGDKRGDTEEEISAALQNEEATSTQLGTQTESGATNRVLVIQLPMKFEPVECDDGDAFRSFDSGATYKSPACAPVYRSLSATPACTIARASLGKEHGTSSDIDYTKMKRDPTRKIRVDILEYYTYVAGTEITKSDVAKAVQCQRELEETFDYRAKLSTLMEDKPEDFETVTPELLADIQNKKRKALPNPAVFPTSKLRVTK